MPEKGIREVMYLADISGVMWNNADREHDRLRRENIRLFLNLWSFLTGELIKGFSFGQKKKLLSVEKVRKGAVCIE